MGGKKEAGRVAVDLAGSQRRHGATARENVSSVSLSFPVSVSPELHDWPSSACPCPAVPIKSSSLLSDTFRST